LKPSAKILILSAAATGVIVALVCVIVSVRSLRAIASAQAPVSTLYNQPTTMPVEPSASAPVSGPTVRVAVIGGMTFTGFWADLSKRYEQQHGVLVQLIATGEKDDIAGVFKHGGVDVITMHASDTVINLVADGYAMEPEPWMRNDLIIVGPPDDPAGIKGMTDAAAALKKIAATKSPFIVQSSLGSQEVLLNIMAPNQIVFDSSQTTILFDDRQRTVLAVAGQKHAYTIVGRIPFRTGRIPNSGLVLMVQDDTRLRRPYIVAVANPALSADVHLAQARRFAAWLRQPDTQRWIASYGRGLIDDHPLFFPVTISAPGPQVEAPPANAGLSLKAPPDSE
jgi:tungstate transport system substrate-binding protein